MTITDKDMTFYDFGGRRIWPKPELKTPYDVLDHFSNMTRGLTALGQLINVSSGRQDHMVQSLDTVAFALKESLFKVMVLREALTGFVSKQAEDDHGTSSSGEQG